MGHTSAFYDHKARGKVICIKARQSFTTVTMGGARENVICTSTAEGLGLDKRRWTAL